MENIKGPSYRDVLESELAARQRRNPAYSLRSFAKALDVAPATICEVLKGTRHITARSAIKMAERLRLSPEDRTRFIESAVGPEIAAQFKGDWEASIADFDADSFHLIADWYHFAILSLGDFSQNEWSSAWIAKMLGIEQNTAEDAMARLERLNLIETSGSSFQQVGPWLRVKSHLPQKAIQSYHLQNLEKARQSLQDVPVSERDFSAVTMAISVAKLDTARKLIQKFREDMSNLLNMGDTHDRVYTLSVQLFPVSKTQEVSS